MRLMCNYSRCNKCVTTPESRSKNGFETLQSHLPIRRVFFPHMAQGYVPILVRWSSRRALRWYYREVHYLGSERIPNTGPVLLFGNHPNDLPDVLAGFFTTHRPVRFVATISVATSALVRMTYRGLGVIPITRVRDARKMRALGVDIEKVNQSAFDSVTQAFADGDVVGVFPQGGVHDTCRIDRPRSGVAKMALNSLDHASISDLTLIAFGVQYEDQSRVRSDMSVLVGEPFSLKAWHARNAESTSSEVADALPVNPDGVDSQQVTLINTLHHSMLAVTRNSDNWIDAGCRDRLVAAVAATSAPHNVPLLAYSTMVQRACSALVAEASEVAERDTVVTDWRTCSDPLAIAVELAGGCKSSARDTARVIDAAGLFNPQADWPSKMWMVFVAAPAVVGLAIHAPVFAAIRLMARKTSKTRADLAARAILPGLYLILLWYLILGGVFALGIRATGDSPFWAIPAVMLFPRLGDVALAWVDGLRAFALRARVKQWNASHRATVRATAEQIRLAWAAIATH